MYTYFWYFFFLQKNKKIAVIYKSHNKKSKHSPHRFAFTLNSAEARSLIINTLYNFCLYRLFFFFNYISPHVVWLKNDKSTYDTDYYMKKF